jgi:hypothetical protein
MSAQLLPSKQTIGNVGLYFVCYELSKLGWNVLPTSRNAKGVDIVAYSADGETVRTVQVKTLGKNDGVPLGKSLESLIADDIIICMNALGERPEIFMINTEQLVGEFERRERRGAINKDGFYHRQRDGVHSYWFAPKKYKGCVRDLKQFGLD